MPLTNCKATIEGVPLEHTDGMRVWGGVEGCDLGNKINQNSQMSTASLLPATPVDTRAEKWLWLFWPAGHTLKGITTLEALLKTDRGWQHGRDSPRSSPRMQLDGEGQPCYSEVERCL